MQFKPPLTQDILREIQGRNLESANVRALLWEIKRLRALALYMDQLQQMMGTLPSQQGDVLGILRRMLAEEPCIKEFPRLQLRRTLAGLIGYFLCSITSSPKVKREIVASNASIDSSSSSAFACGSKFVSVSFTTPRN